MIVQNSGCRSQSGWLGQDRCVRSEIDFLTRNKRRFNDQSEHGETIASAPPNCGSAERLMPTGTYSTATAAAGNAAGAG